MHAFRTHNCGELSHEHIGLEVKISGWVQRIRNLGGMMFLTLRDHYGITQVYLGENQELINLMRNINRESTIAVRGKVLARPNDMINPDMKTGEIEVIAEEIEVLGKATQLLPFEVINSTDAREDLRLKYRFLDLRNEKVHNNIIFRSKIIQYIRSKMTNLGFLEIQTPILTSSSPEGARDYLVPSRVYPGMFYALPQAPQQFKQLLMVSGFDKYFQIAPCFRDEDARADRSPGEFYQLDIEMAFATQEDVFSTVESILYDTFSEFSDWEISKPFEKIPYKDAMLKYGSDKPDLRNPLLIYDATDIFSNTEFNAFKNKTVRVLSVSGAASQSRKFFDKMVKYTVEIGGKGLAWVKIGNDMELAGSIAKFLSIKEIERLIQLTECEVGDALFFIADDEKEATKISGWVRNELGKRLELIEKNVYKFCWVVDFPMYEVDEETNEIEFSHNPFSMPQGGKEALTNLNPLDVLAYQYDIVCNGIELSSGAVRNHDPETMIKAFEIAGYSAKDVEERFSALYNAFQFGAPPHAGIAPGIDRIVMLLADEQNIREVIAFPMNSKAQDLLMGAPSEVKQGQLDDVHILVKEIIKENSEL